VNPTDIEFADVNWNFETGCDTGCAFCYARKFAFRLKGRYGYPRDEPFRCTLHTNKMNDPIKTNRSKKIFVDSMGDLFCKAMTKKKRKEWIMSMFHVIYEANGIDNYHQYQILTKTPQFIPSILSPKVTIPENIWMGVSMTRPGDLWRWVELKRVMNEYPGDPLLWVIFEPLHAEMGLVKDGKLTSMGMEFNMVDWIVVGAETGNRRGKIEPEKDWLIDIEDFCDITDTPLFMKDNLGCYTIPEDFLRQQYPEGVEV